MSKPKRYSIRGFSAALVEEDNGVMVKWEDYAALQAENERLRNLAKDIYERGNVSINKDDWEFVFQMNAAKEVQP